MPLRRATGFNAFLIMWAGQVVSLIGTAMTRFALLFWLWEGSEQATTITLYLFASWVMFLVVTPAAGVIVDRVDRRLLLIVSDLGAALMTVALLGLHLAGRLEVWHVYAAEGLVGGFDALQFAARMAAVSVMLPKEQYARASGMRAFAVHGANIAGPALAGLLLPAIGLAGVMVLDLATFVAAVGGLALIVIPPPTPSEDGSGAAGGLWHEIRFGFRYLAQRPGLAGLAALFFVINTLAALTYFSLFPPMILARSGGSEIALAAVQSAQGVGGVAGAALMTAWGGPRRKIHAVLIGTAFSFMLGDIVMGLGRSLPWWSVGAFSAAFFIPILGGADAAIWQAKVPPDVQGRVFAARMWLQELLMPLGFLATGPLADRVLEPAMRPGGGLAGTFGGLVGTGPGAGMALLFLLTGVLGTLVGLGGYLLPAVRHVEARLPDYDTAQAAAR